MTGYTTTMQKCSIDKTRAPPLPPLPFSTRKAPTHTTLFFPFNYKALHTRKLFHFVSTYLASPFRNMA
jgi:hypothetical protein